MLGSCEAIDVVTEGMHYYKGLVWGDGSSSKVYFMYKHKELNSNPSTYIKRQAWQ